MFVLTETAKAVQNSDSAVLEILLGSILAVCIGLLVGVIVEGKR